VQDVPKEGGTENQGMENGGDFVSEIPLLKTILENRGLVEGR
jgi:hypothetical protein